MNKSLLSLVLAVTPTLGVAAELQLSAAQLKNIDLSTASVSQRQSLSSLDLSGVLSADQRKTHRVAPVVEGMVTELNVVANQRVSKGQVLASLRSRSLGQAQADYLEALARFDLARAERRRIQGLWKDGVLPESRWLKADSEFKSARATFQARRRVLALTGLSEQQIKQLARQPNRLAVFDLVSPIDGVITAVDVESGQLVEAGAAAFHVDDLSSLWATVKIPVANLPQVSAGLKAKVRVKANPSQTYSGQLESLGVEVDMQSQTLAGRIVLQNTDEKLRPGMYAEVRLNGSSNRRLMVPSESVFRMGERNYVFKALGDGRFDPVVVELGEQSSGWTTVRSGVSANERIVSSGVSANERIVSSGVAELKSHWQYQGGE